MSRTTHAPLVILGAGYTGRFLYRAAGQHRRPVFATSRSPETHLSFAQPDHRIRFDLQQPDTWPQIPSQSDIIWCFPALPEDAAVPFARYAIDRDSRLVLLGSTSAYRAGRPGLIDERMPVNRAMPRVSSEEQLRTTCGATILRLSGLYGPGRHVFDWIRRGKIKNSKKYVNLIHVEDVAELCLLTLQYAAPGSTYVVSDGQPRSWEEICRFAAERFQIAVPPANHHPRNGQTPLTPKNPHRLQLSTQTPRPVHGPRRTRNRKSGDIIFVAAPSFSFCHSCMCSAPTRVRHSRASGNPGSLFFANQEKPKTLDPR